MQIVDQEYSTRDLGEAAALLTDNCVMKALRWKDDRAYFIFDNADGNCAKIAHQYFFENLELPVRFYYENLRTIKRKLYQEVGKGRGGNSYV